ncbi:MarR family transcriptional regulator [Candidatus Woesearchaeota archaeon]|nr:MarR family transcriptional regulator [Candidatus Woesearchaeota archaeon]
MLSLSDNEFSVLNFLVRNFTERLTIRNIAQRLGFSPAGVFNILKKLEKNGIVAGQKFGTGLFYQVNFESRIAEHLAQVVLLHTDEKLEKISVEQLKQAKAAILDKKSLLLITDNMTTLEVLIPGIEVIAKSEDEVTALWRKKSQELLQFLKRGTVLLGEEKVVEMIKSCISGF